MPPAVASAPQMSNLERCIALRLVYGAEPRNASKKCHLHHISASLSVVSRVGCPVCPGPHPCFHVLTTSPRHPDSDKPCFFFGDGLCRDTSRFQCFCAVTHNRSSQKGVPKPFGQDACSMHRRQHGWTCPQPLFSFLQCGPRSPTRVQVHYCQPTVILRVSAW